MQTSPSRIRCCGPSRSTFFRLLIASAGDAGAGRRGAEPRYDRAHSLDGPAISRTANRRRSSSRNSSATPATSSSRSRCSTDARRRHWTDPTQQRFRRRRGGNRRRGAAFPAARSKAARYRRRRGSFISGWTRDGVRPLPTARRGRKGRLGLRVGLVENRRRSFGAAPSPEAPAADAKPGQPP